MMPTLDKSGQATSGSLDSPDQWMLWKGPYGAVHHIRKDFWKRVTNTFIESKIETTDNDYWHLARFGKIHRIPASMLDEFRSGVDTSNGTDHTEIDPWAIDTTI